MNYFRLIIIYSSLILFVFYRLGQCEEFAFDFAVQKVSIYGMEEKTWESLYLSKKKCSDTYIFRNDDLSQTLGGEFPSSVVEIIQLFGKIVRLSLIRGTTQWIFDLLFVERSSVQQFFEDIRSQRKKEYGKGVSIEKLFQYQIDEAANNEDPLQLISRHVLLYPKKLDAKWFGESKTFTFLYNASSSRSQGVDLVLLSKAFNISETFSSNKFVLCVRNIKTYRFILRFNRSKFAEKFYEFVKNDLDRQIPCLAEWVSYDLLTDVNSR